MRGRGHRVHWPEGFGADGSTPIGYCDGTQQLWKGQACEGEMEFSTTEKHLKGILGGAEQYSRVTNKTMFRQIKTSVAIGKPVITTSWLLKEISDRGTVDGALSRKRWNVSPFSKKVGSIHNWNRSLWQSSDSRWQILSLQPKRLREKERAYPGSCKKQANWNEVNPEPRGIGSPV